jgi:hypothetical protein
MKTFSAALAIVLASCTVGAAAAEAVTPKKGNWRIKNASAPTESNSLGFMKVYKKRKRTYVSGWTSPSLYVKCVGSGASPEDMNPGYEFLGAGFSKAFKLGKKAKFSYSKKLEGQGGVVVDFTGRFTSKKKAKGTMRVRFTGNPNRRCDSGTLNWTSARG